MRKIIWRTGSLFMVMALLLSVFPFVAAHAAAGDWNYSLVDVDAVTEGAQYFYEGIGTGASPYKIGTAQELANLAYLINNQVPGYYTASYELTADITLNDWTDDGDGLVEDGELLYMGGSANLWIPIGTSSVRFSGSFDGKGHIINGIYIKKTGTAATDNYQGLFGNVQNGTIRDLTVAKGYIFGFSYIGGITGNIYGTGTIDNCRNECTVTGRGYDSSYSGYGGVGGIAGYSAATVSNCSNSGLVSSQKPDGCTSYSAQNIGGIVGNNNGGTISYCYNNGIIDGSSVITYQVGGVAGCNESYSVATSIQNSYNTGYVSGNSYIGGIAGASQSWGGPVTVEYCFNTGSVNGGYYAGGIAGGAMGGYSAPNGASLVQQCYNAGHINGSYAGGVVGLNRKYTEGSTTTSTVERCYNTGTLSGYSPGGVVGLNTIGTCIGTVTNCFYDKQMCTCKGIGGTASDTLGQTEGRLTSAMVSAEFVGVLNSAQTSFLYAEGLYPRLIGLGTSDAAYVSASPVYLYGTNTVSLIEKNFTVSTLNGVGWASGNPGIISIDGGNATLLGAAVPGTVVNLTAGLNGIAKTVKVTPCATIVVAGVSGIIAPSAGVLPQVSGSLMGRHASYTVTGLSWKDSDGTTPATLVNGRFMAGTVYKAVIELTAATGYKFLPATPEVNAGTAEAGAINEDAIGNKLTFTVTFPATAEKTVTGIQIKNQPADLTYTEGETLDLSGLEVTLTYNDTSTADVALAQFAANGIAASPLNGAVMSVASHNGNPVTLTCNGFNATTGNLTVEAAPTYTIAAISDQTMTAKTAGYGSGTQETRTITITRTGTGDLTNPAVSLSGGASSSFAVTQPIDAALNSGTPSTTFTVKAVDGLAAGTYTETVTVSADNMANVTFVVTQVVNPLSAPTIQSAVAGDEHVSINWSTVSEATGYKIFSSNTPGSYGAALDTVSSSTDSYDITGLTNGTTCYFVVKATNGGSDSINSNEVSATPRTVPCAPANVTAAAGDGQAAVSFTPPADNGGNAITGYTVTSSPGGITSTGVDTTITVTGLSNGTAYTFTVTASNAAGTGQASPASNAVIPYKSITAAGITGINAPGAGAVPQEKGNLTAGHESYTVTGLSWKDSDGTSPAVLTDGKFKAETVYKAVIELTAATGCKFQLCTPAVDAGTAEAGAINEDAIGNKLTFTVTFPATAAKIVTGIQIKNQPADLIYDEGETLDLTGLEVTLTYNDSSTADVIPADFAASGITASPHGGAPMEAAVHNGHPITLSCNGYDTTTGNLSVNVPVPGVPSIQSATAGDGMITVAWGEVPGSISYNIYSTTASGVYMIPSTTVAGAVYSCDVTGLTNGTAYYFIVTAVNAGGESAYSDEVSATPRTVPGAPANVTATAGDGQAAVSFTPPTDNGGNAITGYTVTSSPGGITSTGTGTTITIIGLSNGTAYTFTVMASNAAGTGPASPASNTVIPYRSSSDDSESDSGGDTTPANGVDILVNGRIETAATATTTQNGNNTVTTIELDDNKVQQRLEREGDHTVVTIPVNSGAEVVVGQLNGQTVKNMENRDAVLEIKTEHVKYTLPALQINIGAISERIGNDVALKDIAVSVKISEPAADTARIVEDTANKNNYQIVVKPIEFEITCSSGNKTVEVSKFNAYVERLIAIPEGVDPSRITTGIILNEDGTFSHVPTVITVINGKYYAKINSLTNSVYSVISSPKAFADVENHWAKEAVNDMASRLVINGGTDGLFSPDKEITRAEFASIVIRALGLLRPGTGKDVFNDVMRSDWYYDAISIAYEYGIISGYGNARFGPEDTITREQAFAIIARAMKTTRLSASFESGEEEQLLEAFSDIGQASGWAKSSISSCIKAEIVSGRSGKLIAPMNNITRAEVAAIVRRLLQKSGLI